jgi:tetratricopeptide (TPR) repeat protein
MLRLPSSSARVVLALVLTSSAGDGLPIGAAPDAERPSDSAIASMHRRAAAATPGTPEASALSLELAEAGRAFLARGDTARAIELYEEACGLDAENGLALAELTLAYVRREDFDSARFYLHLAQERSPRSPPAVYETLGEIYYALNRLDDAVAAWEHYRRLGGENPRTLGRLVATLQELSMASGQRVLLGESFALYYDPPIPKTTVAGIGEHLEKIRREQSEFFGEDLTGRQVVVLYAGRTYFSLVSIPEWVSGVFDGKIRISLEPEGGLTPQLQSVLTHELAHAFVRSVSRDRAPGWLHEGLAQWWEGERILRDEIRKTFAGRAPYSLKEMEGNLSRKAERAAVRANYVQALALVEYVVERNGPASLACLVRSLGEGRSLSDALRGEIGLSPDELLARWKTWAKL